ncbi:MAG: hypothetical protein OXT09_03950, partial [Myxococcales bacterium]|nr:hypothetical protein [Myxococcales bacterium]
RRICTRADPGPGFPTPTAARLPLTQCVARPTRHPAPTSETETETETGTGTETETEPRKGGSLPPWSTTSA